METNPWVRWDRLMRAAHLYTGLFLVPWMMVYAISAFCLNHKEWFIEGLQLAPKWQLVHETDFAADAAFPYDPEEQAKAILKHLDLEGAHTFMGAPNPSQMTILRFCGTGHYRITWHRQQSRLVVEKQRPVSFYSVVNALHFQHGYGQPFFAHLTWAAIVDTATVSTVIWVISGIYLWARRPRRRLLGGLCMVAGILLFVALAILLCQ
jgi:hypothetical protein